MSTQGSMIGVGYRIFDWTWVGRHLEQVRHVEGSGSILECS